MDDTRPCLGKLTKKFFGAFSTAKDRPVKLDVIYDLFIPQGILIKNVGEQTEIYNLDQFIKPREKLLNSGALVEFSEREIDERTEVFGNIAQRWSIYEKSGVLDGKSFHTKGMKTIQFVKMNEKWHISAVAWDDERDGLSID